MTLRDRIEKREERERGGMPQSASFHSRGYHRYFEGYSEQTFTDARGKKHIKRVYTGVYHRAQISDAKLSWTKRTYFLLLILSALVCLFAVSRPSGSNACWYVAVFAALSVLGFLWLLYALVCYATAGRDMTAEDFRSVASLKNAARFKGVCEGLTGIATLGYLIAGLVTGTQVSVAEELLCLGLSLVSAVLTLLIPYLEKQISYTSFLSKEQPLPDGNQIDS